MTAQQAPDLTTDALWDLLNTRQQGVLTTIKRDGRPQLSNISFAYDPATRVLTTQAATFRAKTRNLLRDARASVHVSSTDFRIWMVAEGIATLSEPACSYDDEVGQQFIAGIREREPGITDEALAVHLEDYPILDRVFIRIHVDRIYGGNGTKALGISDS